MYNEKIFFFVAVRRKTKQFLFDLHENWVYADVTSEGESRMIKRRHSLKDFFLETLYSNLVGTTAILFFFNFLHESCGVIPPLSNNDFLSNNFQIDLLTIDAVDLKIVLNTEGVFE
jgi:hypothetical protein